MGESRFLTAHGLKSSMDKLFGILGNIAVEPFSVESQHGKIQLNYAPPDKIIVSDNLFRQYDCLGYACSRCCWKIRDWNIFTSEQYKQLPDTHKGFGQELPVKIGGKIHKFYIEDNTDDTCKHLDNNSCGIHEYNPLHCALPLIKFKRTNRDNSEITYITREVYTRNWHMQCPVEFKTMDDEGFRKTLWIFERIKDMADELNINTSIDQIILAVENRRNS